VGALADAISLRVTNLGPRMLNVIDSQVQLVVVALGPAAVFRAAVGQG